MTVTSGLQLDVDLTSRRHLRDEAYIALRRAILSGTLAPGDHLVERQIAGSLGLSRSPVREAFRRLEQEGLVRAERFGVEVCGLDFATVRELYQIRQQLEALIARLAARNFTPAHRPEIEALLAEMATSMAASDSGAALGAGVRFHQALARLAGNRRLALLTSAISEEIHRFRGLNMAGTGRGQTALDEHRQLAAAVIARDEEAAARLMAEHIEHALSYTQEHRR